MEICTLRYFFLVPRLKSSGFQSELSPNQDFSFRQFKRIEHEHKERNDFHFHFLETGDGMGGCISILLPIYENVLSALLEFKTLDTPVQEGVHFLCIAFNSAAIDLLCLL